MLLGAALGDTEAGHDLQSRMHGYACARVCTRVLVRFFRSSDDSAHCLLRLWPPGPSHHQVTPAAPATTAPNDPPTHTPTPRQRHPPYQTHTRTHGCTASSHHHCRTSSKHSRAPSALVISLRPSRNSLVGTMKPLLPTTGSRITPAIWGRGDEERGAGGQMAAEALEILLRCTGRHAARAGATAAARVSHGCPQNLPLQPSNAASSLPTRQSATQRRPRSRQQPGTTRPGPQALRTSSAPIG